MKKLLLLSASLSVLVAADLAVAQQQGEEDEVLTVIGSRVPGRTALDSMVPVDVIQVGELQTTPSLNLKDAISAISPSYVVERNAIADGGSLVRTNSLRGLASHEVLVLLNGKRTHKSAILSGGAQSTDLGTFSVNSLKNIAILRDGAAAQYGADAVAGVINLTLDDSEGISGEARYSKFYAGDGAAFVVASKVGLSLADRGFLTITASYGKQNPTDRATVHLNAVDLIDKWNRQEAGTLTGPAAAYDGQFNDPGDLDPDTIAPFGVNEQTNFNITWNSEMDVGENTKIYAFGNFSRVNLKEPFNYRPGLPHGYTTIGPWGAAGGRFGAQAQTGYTYAAYEALRGTGAANQYEYLLLDERRTITNSAIGAGEFDDGDGFIVDGAGAQLFQDNPNGGFSALGTHPNGYNPWFTMDSKDLSAYIGFKGEFDNGLTYDLSASLGRNRVDHFLADTHNPSLGAPKAADGTIDYANAQTEFYLGALVNIERSVGVDFAYEIETDSVDNLNVAFGGEYRSEQYFNVVGEEGSWKQGPLAGPNGGLRASSDGFAGFSPTNNTDDSRHNYAVYVDVESDINEDISVGVAARYEDFSDFGDNFSWKVSGRYQAIDDLLAIRGAASTGFHAPSVGQIKNQQVATGFNPDGTQNESGRFPADSDLAGFFGAIPLKAETAQNLSAGIVLTPGENTNITIDVFQIKLADRIGNSQDFERDDYPAAFAALTASGFVGADSLTEVRFFANNQDTTTKGIEAVVTHNIDFDSSNLQFTLAYAHVSTRITKFDPVTTDLQSRYNVEHDTAPHKVSFTTNYSMENWSFMGRARWWATQKEDRGLDANGGNIDDNDPNRRIDENPGKVFFDLAVTYDIDDQFSITVGADNVLDSFPKIQPGVVEASHRRGRQYLEGPGWQGGSYYARVKANF